MKKVISGIQQIGIGVPNVHEAFAWYRKAFGVDIRVFEDDGKAELMLPYTGGQPHSRHAVLAVNMQGGGGFEIWQYKSRKPVAASFKLQLGDLGINIAKIKSYDVEAAYRNMKDAGLKVLSPLETSPWGSKHFFVEDPYQNIFDVVESKSRFSVTKASTGGAFGAIIGVTDIARSIQFYSDVLGYDDVVYDETKKHADFSSIANGNLLCRRVLLRHSEARKGAFSKLLGPSEIELVQVLGYPARKIFEGRFWGDLGFIHLCFDVKGADLIKEQCKKLGHPFTVDTGSSFDMGEAAGRFAYVEDPDGSLIEFVETYKVPVAKKYGIFINLTKRDPEKALPSLFIKALGLNRVKD